MASGAPSGIERLLWQTRYLVVVPVVGSVLMAIGAIYLATVDAVSLIVGLVPYAAGVLSGDAHANVEVQLLGGVIRAIDVYLLAAFLLIFALGLYELFIAKLDGDIVMSAAPRLLQIRTLDELKDRMAKVVLLVLVVEFLQQALRQTYGSPLDLLYLGIGILFVGGALFLSNVGGHGDR